MKKIIITVGPSILHNKRIVVEDSTSHIYRINGAHGSINDVEKWIKFIRDSFGDAGILIDLPGNKIRTANLNKPINLSVKNNFSLKSNQVTYKNFYTLVKKGDIVLADDSTLRFIVHDVKDKETFFTSESDGLLMNNKGLHIKGINENLPFIFPRDKELIDVANTNKVRFVGLSFVRNTYDIDQAKNLINKDIKIIAKIETQSAVNNLNGILKIIDYALIDRGDLSTDIGLEKVASYQKFIIDKCLFYNKRVFLATQFLKNMANFPVPTIAEVIDLYNSFKMGIYGIQLSEETATGMYPKECLKIIKKVLKEIESEVN